MALSVRNRGSSNGVSAITTVPAIGFNVSDAGNITASNLIAYKVLISELGINSLDAKLKKTSKATAADPAWNNAPEWSISNDAVIATLRTGDFNDRNLIQQRLLSIAKIVLGLSPTFVEFYNQYVQAGDPQDKAIKNSLEEIDQMFQLKIAHLNKIDPDVIYESYIVGRFQNQEMGQRIANYTKLE